MGDPEMKDPKEISLSISGRILTIEVALQDEDLIETLFGALSEYVKEGTQLKIMQTYSSPLTESTKIMTKLISKGSQMMEWRDEMRQLMCLMKKEACF